jgi:hypothetical protein
VVASSSVTQHVATSQHNSDANENSTEWKRQIVSHML